MEFIIEKESQKASVIKAVEKLMQNGRPHMWLQFLVDIQSAAIHLKIAGTVSHMDENILQGIAFRATDLSNFFTDLVDIQQEN